MIHGHAPSRSETATDVEEYVPALNASRRTATACSTVTLLCAMCSRLVMESIVTEQSVSGSTRLFRVAA
jgi:hypothetical protein